MPSLLTPAPGTPTWLIPLHETDGGIPLPVGGVAAIPLAGPDARAAFRVAAGEEGAVLPPLLAAYIGSPDAWRRWAEKTGQQAAVRHVLDRDAVRLVPWADAEGILQVRRGIRIEQASGPFFRWVIQEERGEKLVTSDLDLDEQAWSWAAAEPMAAMDVLRAAAHYGLRATAGALLDGSLAWEGQVISVDQVSADVMESLLASESDDVRTAALTALRRLESAPSRGRRR